MQPKVTAAGEQPQVDNDEVFQTHREGTAEERSEKGGSSQRVKKKDVGVYLFLSYETYLCLS